MYASSLLEVELSRMQLKELERQVIGKRRIGGLEPSSYRLWGPKTLLAAHTGVGAVASRRRVTRTP